MVPAAAAAITTSITLEKKMPRQTALLFVLFSLASSFTGCARLESVDRSLLNHQAMDLRVANSLGQPAPASGLRNLKKTSGGESCSVCAK